MNNAQQIHASVLEGHERSWRVVLDGVKTVDVRFKDATSALVYAQNTEWATMRVMRMVLLCGEWKEEACEAQYYRTSDGQMWPVGGKRSKRNNTHSQSHGDAK